MALRPGRVADQAREISDQENHFVAEILKAAHFVNQHRVPEMQIRRGRVETGLDTQRLAPAQLGEQLGLEQDFGGAALEFGELLFRRWIFD